MRTSQASIRKVFGAVFVLWQVAAGAAEIDGIIGNGGDAVVCGSGTKTTVESYDLFEARTWSNVFPSLGDKNTPYLQKIELALKRWERVDSANAAIYRNEVVHYLDKFAFVSGLPFENIPDEGSPVRIPTGCTLTQAAIQEKPEFPNQRPVKINNDLFTFMPENDKAALIMHELFYTAAIKRGQMDSRRVRYFNSMLLSDYFAKATPAQYIQVALASDFILPIKSSLNIDYEQSITLHPNGAIKQASIGTDGGVLKTDKVGVYGSMMIDFYDNYSVKSANLCAKSDDDHAKNCPVGTALGVKPDVLNTVPLLNPAPGCTGFVLPGEAGTRVDFYDKLALKMISWNGLSLPLHEGQLKIHPTVCFTEGSTRKVINIRYSFDGVINDKIEFYESGVPKAIVPMESFFPSSLKCKSASVSAHSVMEFNSNGVVKRINAGDAIGCQTASGDEIPHAKIPASFNDQGQLISQ